MHIPDGFLSNQVNFSLLAASFLVASVAFKKVKNSLFEKSKAFSNQLMTNVGASIGLKSEILTLEKNANKKLQQMALVASFIFAAQMINFPVANGTSGHLIGGVLAAVVLGPWAGMLVISVVLAIQAIMFGDGGIIALGANILNMGVIATIGGYYFYFFIKKIFKNENIAIALAGWISVVMAAIFCSLELAFSKTISFALVMPDMVFIHMLIGIGEALITVLALMFLFSKDKSYGN